MAADDPDDDLHEKFLDYVARFESAEPRALFDVLSEGGQVLPAPEEMDDAQLTRKLWEVIHGLALVGTFLENTDHLSDRELYTELWGDLLRDPVTLFPDDLDYACHLDMIGSGSDEDNLLRMKYYAGEKERQDWLKEWPDDVLPEREDPPYDRDRFLPRSESRQDGPVM